MVVYVRLDFFCNGSRRATRRLSKNCCRNWFVVSWVYFVMTGLCQQESIVRGKADEKQPRPIAIHVLFHGENFDAKLWRRDGHLDESAYRHLSLKNADPLCLRGLPPHLSSKRCPSSLSCTTYDTYLIKANIPACWFAFDILENLRD